MDIQHFDRSTKVWIECKNHPESKWYSKDPFVSNWFAQPSNCDAFGVAKCNCECQVSEYILSEDYVS
jgi:hypothetical protein